MRIFRVDMAMRHSLAKAGDAVEDHPAAPDVPGLHMLEISGKSGLPDI
jgi:hypothetical protein